jgi:hypothetical protein
MAPTWFQSPAYWSSQVPDGTLPSSDWMAAHYPRSGTMSAPSRALIVSRAVVVAGVGVVMVSSGGGSARWRFEHHTQTHGGQRRQ